MINLEQVKLLESKVAKAIDYIERVIAENAALRQRETELQLRLESYQKRIDELDVIIMQFREDHGQIENGILAALDRLTKFEEALEKSVGAGKIKIKEPAVQQTVKTPKAAKKETENDETEKNCFEIAETAETITIHSLEEEEDITDPLTDEEPSVLPETEGEELDIF